MSPNTLRDLAEATFNEAGHPAWMSLVDGCLESGRALALLAKQRVVEVPHEDGMTWNHASSSIALLFAESGASAIDVFNGLTEARRRVWCKIISSVEDNLHPDFGKSPSDAIAVLRGGYFTHTVTPNANNPHAAELHVDLTWRPFVRANKSEESCVTG